VANMKVVALFVSFPTSICASRMDHPSSSYDLRNEKLCCRNLVVAGTRCSERCSEQVQELIENGRWGLAVATL
ncbi:hypothetical protein A2U01_0099290, partial [Trifolium medium]|nr:hypothetical protein [Trifolium medium]